MILISSVKSDAFTASLLKRSTNSRIDSFGRWVTSNIFIAFFEDRLLPMKCMENFPHSSPNERVELEGKELYLEEARPMRQL